LDTHAGCPYKNVEKESGRILTGAFLSRNSPARQRIQIQSAVSGDYDWMWIAVESQEKRGAEKCL
jgi:hypothetical protein